jgi:ribosomal protein S18
MNVENVEPRVIQQLLDDVETRKRKSKEHCGMTHGKWDYTKIRMACAAFIDDAGKFDASRWSQLSPEKQEELLKRLTTVRDELLSVSERRG